MKMEIKQLIAGIIITLGLFGIGFGFGYNYCWNECYTDKEDIDYSFATNATDLMVLELNEGIENATMEHKDFR